MSMCAVLHMEVVMTVLAATRVVLCITQCDLALVLFACRENAEARIWGRLGELQSMKKQRRRNKQ